MGGKLVDAEPSRFITEIDDQYLEHTTPMDDYRYKSALTDHLWDEPDKSKLRQRKPVSGKPPSVSRPSEDQIRKLRKIRPSTSSNTSAPSGFEGSLEPGMIVSHGRFGLGTVVNIEGAGGEKKAEINFQVGGIKKLLLRFAKLDVIDE
ncbi:ATP-dependent DNA helicase UvrD/PcrA [Nonlabens ulvanivorans]|nr:ATP-dependent DNA helicase UvrD/PcrA [Nonlabens ulvanivorans]